MLSATSDDAGFRHWEKSMATARLGHAHIFVRDVERSAEFYADVFGLNVTEHRPGEWAFLSSGELHHELALSQVGADAAGPAENAVGLFHLGFDVDNRTEFAEVFQRLLDRGVDVNPVDHRISWGVYFADPDGNGLEICLDTREEAAGADYWEGENRPLTPEKILAATR